MDEKKLWLKRCLAGGCAALLALLLVTICLNSAVLWGGRSNYAHLSLVTNQMAAIFGSSALAAGVQALLVFALGSGIGAATLPFAEQGWALLLRSLLHFGVTGALAALLCGVCCWGLHPAAGFGLYALLYLAIWLARYAGWLLELERIRSALGLQTAPSPLKWRESLPYVLLLAFLFLLLLPLAGILDGQQLSILRTAVLPWIVCPLAALAAGFTAGLRQGLCPLVPAAAVLVILPGLLWLDSSGAWQQGILCAALSLAGNLAAAALRRASRRKELSR